MKWILTVIFNFLVCIFLLFWGFLAGYNLRKITARLYDKYQLYLLEKEFSKTPYAIEMRNDFFGGSTPRDVWKKFRSELQSGNLDRAVNYFWGIWGDEKEKGRWKKYLEEKKDSILKYPEKLVFSKELLNEDLFDEEVGAILARKENGKLYGGEIVFRKNHYTNLWKIRDIDVDEDFSYSLEEYYKEAYKGFENFVHWKFTEEEKVEQSKLITQHYYRDKMLVEKAYEILYGEKLK